MAGDDDFDDVRAELADFDKMLEQEEREEELSKIEREEVLCAEMATELHRLPMPFDAVLASGKYCFALPTDLFDRIWEVLRFDNTKLFFVLAPNSISVEASAKGYAARITLPLSAKCHTLTRERYFTYPAAVWRTMRMHRLFGGFIHFQYLQLQKLLRISEDVSDLPEMALNLDVEPETDALEERFSIDNMAPLQLRSDRLVAGIEFCRRAYFPKPDVPDPARGQSPEIAFKIFDSVLFAGNNNRCYAANIISDHKLSFGIPRNGAAHICRIMRCLDPDSSVIRYDSKQVLMSDGIVSISWTNAQDGVQIRSKYYNELDMLHQNAIVVERQGLLGFVRLLFAVGRFDKKATFAQVKVDKDNGQSSVTIRLGMSPPPFKVRELGAISRIKVVESKHLSSGWEIWVNAYDFGSALLRMKSDTVTLATEVTPRHLGIKDKPEHPLFQVILAGQPRPEFVGGSASLERR